MITIINIGNKLKLLREDKGISQIQLGLRFNISQESISSYELGKSNPSFDILCKYADYFRVSLDYIFGRTDTKTPIQETSLNPFELFFIASYRSLSEPGKNMMSKTIAAIKDADEENKELFP